MVTMTLTEFNQNPSQATRLADSGQVLVLRRGKPAYRLERVAERPGDPVDALVQAGLLSPARRQGTRRTPLPHAQAGADAGALLEADRSRLDG
ncbi:MAG: hypothetical protein LBI33_12060 [Propionibacteriaceae bacterium]|jgi:hypothetical protein|nr:hypothetical protein [Propionibacteriaceae bacterium]